MLKLVIIFLILILSGPSREKKYIIVAGEITCKACVIQLHNYLQKKIRKQNLTISLRDKGNIILNEMSLSYFRQELPKAQFVFLNKASLFPNKEKYPYLLSIVKQDTLKLPYDSLFYDEDLNTRHLR